MIKSGRKIIFFDIDGTVYDHRTGIEPSTRQAIHALVENGHIPVLCTGRARSMIMDELIELGFQGIIGACGTYVEYQGTKVMDVVLDKSELSCVIDAAVKYQIRAMFEGSEALTYEESLKMPDYLERTRHLKEKYKFVHPITRDTKVNKLTVHFNELEELKDFLTAVEGILEPIIHLEPGGYNYAECVPIGFTKATGIEIMLNRLKIDKKDSFAFGDSVNDLEMLNYVEYGIAMGNSSEEVLKAAKYHTCGMYEDGIYKGLKDFALI